jgi:hypothetical protein
MGTVIRFPKLVHGTQSSGRRRARSSSATIIILPVIRIDRHPDVPSERETSRSQRRRRRRRASRTKAND